jgi:hypothetical protein
MDNSHVHVVFILILAVLKVMISNCVEVWSSESLALLRWGAHYHNEVYYVNYVYYFEVGLRSLSH